ncbi:glycosyltransferase family 2 protein [Enterococcus sp. AD013-P3]|uniref:glycosyltransferase family 2 protein n=1 Tax=Enterococcus sp. AD013-P3 TaxID=3411036 RepID=UPI003B954CB6
MNIRYSIIVPVFNAEDTIDESLERIAKLQSDSYECIVVNDGSTDRTAAVVQSFVATHPHFSLISVENGGPGIARNHGITRAKGDYLLFFDADDFPSDKILSMYDRIIADEPTLDLIISSFEFIEIEDGKIINCRPYTVENSIYDSNETFVDDLYDLMNRQLMYVVWNKCYRTKIIRENEIRFRPYRSCEDRIFNLDYAQFCNKVVLNSQVAYHYNFDSKSGLTNRYSPEKFFTFTEFYKRAEQVSDGKNKDGLASLFLKGVISTCFSIMETTELSFGEKNRQIREIQKSDEVTAAKKVARKDSISKRLTKLFFYLPTVCFLFVIWWGSVIEVKTPKLMGFFKRVY